MSIWHQAICSDRDRFNFLVTCTSLHVVNLEADRDIFAHTATWTSIAKPKVKTSLKRQRLDEETDGAREREKQRRTDSEASIPSRGATDEENVSDGVSKSEMGSAELALKRGFFSGTDFADLPLSEDMHSALGKLGFTTTTKIQVMFGVFRHWSSGRVISLKSTLGRYVKPLDQFKAFR